MAKCQYQKGIYRCPREALPASPNCFCILHEDWELKDPEETTTAFNKEIEEGKTDFTGCILPEIDLSVTTIAGDAVFDGTRIEGKAMFFGARIEGDAWFTEAAIKGDAVFEGSQIEEVAFFTGATIEGDARFDGATIKENTKFIETTIKGHASFDGAKIEEDAYFSHSSIGSLTFRNTKFKKMEAQEKDCRAAKRTQEEIGDRVEADYHFYREMEAKRKQKKWYERYILEWPLQYIFGYGVHLRRIMLWWGAIVALFFIFYAVGNGVTSASHFPIEYAYLNMLLAANPGNTVYILALINPISETAIGITNYLESTFLLSQYLQKCLYFSVTSAATPGYGGYSPKPGFEALTIIEAILGTFTWAAFIATVARKYMRT